MSTSFRDTVVKIQAPKEAPSETPPADLRRVEVLERFGVTLDEKGRLRPLKEGSERPTND